MIGQSFGNYRAVSLLGEGGMGVVYLAEHPEIGRKVAVKVLHRDFARDEQLLGRFLNEARAANAIRHPNIIEILDSGMLADRTPFLVMELLEGESLASRIKREGRLPIRDAVDFIYQTASALNAAHAKGIVHRDLKPDNLFIVADPHDPDRERIKVLDFGIAKLQQSQPGDSVKTRTGTLMGTPIYMSPEQCRGIRTVDHRTDVYSLGVILYEMLNGQPPFVSEGFGDLVNMHINMVPPPLRGLRPDVPERLEAVIMKMLAKSPDERYEGMAAFQAALKQSCEGFFTMRGSSPDIGSRQRTRPGGTVAFGSERTQTTLATGVGEQIPYNRSRGKTAAIAFGLVAVAAAGFFVYQRGMVGGRGRTATATATATPPGTIAGGSSPSQLAPPVVAPVTAPPAVAPPARPVAAPAQASVTVVIESTPPGARVVGTQDGKVLGQTPLTLTRAATGGELGVRIEKDGYVAVEQSVTLKRDETLAVTLEKKRAAHAPRHPSVEEPAKL
jgi:serine/threonine-protein kinase